MKSLKPFIFKIGGEAGFGIMSAGLIFSKLAVRSGYYVFNYTEYPSIVRGGHNVMQVAIADESIGAPYWRTDFLIALNQQTIDLHIDELEDGASLIYDAEKCELPKISKKINVFAVPMNRLAKEIGDALLLRNTVSLGAAAALLGGEFEILKDLLAKEFSKHPELVENNYRVAAAGYEYIKEHYQDKICDLFKPKHETNEQIVITGNEAIALGAVAAGMQFAAIYPMTPINNILHTLAPLQEKYGFIYKQPEDEIAGINMAIGASFAGARAMTATAGGGFCLMTEAYGLAGMTETPLVIIEGMRGGPATGLPTWTGQGDLRFVLHAHQEEFPKIILTAGDTEEAFYLAMQAFNLADKYQTPVVIITDKLLCESHISVRPFNYEDYKINRGKLVTEKQADYRRYVLANDGISPRSAPGYGNEVVANSDEHDESGYSNETSQNRKDQMNKRMQKLQTCAKEDMPPPHLFGPKKADLTIVSWGSNKGVILEAMKHFANVNFLHLTWINPFPAEAVKDVLSKARSVLNVECNYSGQMSGLIKEKTGIEITNNLLKYDGRPFFTEEIISAIKNILKLK